MNAILERVAGSLFASDDHRAGNVKFFRGTCSAVTAEQLAAQLEAATDQVQNQTAVRVENIDGYQPVAR